MTPSKYIILSVLKGGEENNIHVIEKTTNAF